MNAQALSTNAVALRLTALRGFLAFARVTGACTVPDDALKMLLKRPKVNVERPYSVLTAAELESLIEAIPGGRDRCMIRIAHETGIPCDELLAVKVSDIFVGDTGRLFLRIRHGKGDKPRSVPLSGREVECLNSVLSSAGKAIGRDDSYLFESRNGGRMDTSRVRQILIAARKKAGIAKPVSAHSLRHTLAIRWLRHSNNVNGVSKLLGHASLTTTTRYLDHIQLDELVDIVDGQKAIEPP